MAISEVDLIINQAKSLSGKISDKDKLNLIQRIAEVLQKSGESVRASVEEPRYLIYGEFYDPKKMSTEKDFESAEYRFNEDEWND